MSDLTIQCERCGGALSPQGQCLVCGVDQSRLDEEQEKSLAEREESLLSSQAPMNAAPIGAQLVNRATSERYALTQSVSKIGRDANNAIALSTDSYISRHHAWVLFIKGSYWVEDLGSTNGTLLNGDLLTERRQILPGDCLKLGRTELTFELS